MICEMRINLDEWELSDVPVVREMAGQIIMKFDKYWAQIHGILVMAIILYLRLRCNWLIIIFHKFMVRVLQMRFKGYAI